MSAADGPNRLENWAWVRNLRNSASPGVLTWVSSASAPAGSASRITRVTDSFASLTGPASAGRGVPAVACTAKAMQATPVNSARLVFASMASVSKRGCAGA